MLLVQSPKIGKKTGGFWYNETEEEGPNDSIFFFFWIGQNTEKSPGELRRLAITQTLVENHKRYLMWKTLKKKKSLEYMF